MPVASTQRAHPSNDKRFELLEVELKRNQYRPDALLEVLHAAQGLFGYLEMDLLYFVARRLKMPPSRVYGVATFYHLFTLQPKGQHTCIVCTGTACYVKGAGELLEGVEQQLQIRAGETTADGRVSLLTARCFGASGVAPAVMLDDNVVGHVTADVLREKVKGWLAGGTDGSA